MGYAIPAAVGAKLARPDRPAVVVTGDGGFLMSGFALGVAARERIPLTVVVFCDGELSLIRHQQMERFGHDFAMSLGDFNYRSFAEAVGVRYGLLDANMGDSIHQALESNGVSLVELRLGEDPSLQRVARRARATESLKRALGPRVVSGVKRFLRKIRGTRRET